ncbi:glycosyltransferase [Salinisphaera sp. Q1T1-3]|uniref:glycosyltransferase family 2 protein n=1 Tax=Salinisphaera sp. Q1T1-3 TaxID=2321229 RepID=UPI000E752711|nr:glycosyltransferase [Salinisphaera sp. Q1T1-3]RJS94687.1 glycosyltransferase [Salinisphaera sp. Q1T1-3]
MKRSPAPITADKVLRRAAALHLAPTHGEAVGEDRQALKTRPLVSVLMTVYNAGDFLEPAIESVLGQTWTYLELVIVDDGSTDGSLERIRHAGWRDARVRVIENEHNLGQPASRNKGIQALRGDFLAFMDADDLSHPERLSRQVAFLEAHSQIDLVGTCWSPIDVDGQLLPRKTRQRQRFTSHQIAARLLFYCPIHHPTMMIRARVAKDLHYDTAFPVAQDHDLWVRLMPNYRFAVLPECLFYYRQHDHQAISDGNRMMAGRRRIFEKQLAELDIDFDAQDSYRHFHLFHFRGRNLFRAQCAEPLDVDFVRWAGQWMARLAAANRHKRLYPEPAFSRFLGARWLFVCRKASAESDAPLRIWAIFLRSSLTRAVARALLARELDPF